MDKESLNNVNSSDTEQIRICIEQNANNCNFELGELCKFCFVWINKNVPRNCPWVRKK